MPRLLMLKTAAGPDGVFKAGQAYTVNPKIHKDFCGGEHPAALDYSEAAEIAAESGGEVPEGDSVAAVPANRGKRKSRKRAASRG